LALALEGGISGFCAYLDGETPSGIALRFIPCAFERLCALDAELGGERIFGFAGGATANEWRRAFLAEFRPVRIFSSALGAAHCGFPQWLVRRSRLNSFQGASQGST